jgi:hypothetical protein
MELDFRDENSSYSGGLDRNTSLIDDTKSVGCRKPSRLRSLHVKSYQNSLKMFEVLVNVLDQSRLKKTRRLYTARKREDDLNAKLRSAL